MLSEEHVTREELSCHYFIPQINSLSTNGKGEESVKEIMISPTPQLSRHYLYYRDYKLIPGPEILPSLLMSKLFLSMIIFLVSTFH